ncbi:carboxypeptidase regulatory-like domain-containing protein [Luteolibacter yonseiensis]|uniref:Carboxypeptidase regulatory-like domain-containing protein n=2 Tax=Luteolibacter yonseiensis TaxID=1144680 RepID=A0A934V5J6_9BACT|nr:carboxypeptidase-like regulatory domain-containing protein [Luteolibacter yonseiensis]MBK1814012.1 carboxypeptidase regulatory-like domain-containing protein [Luteolibacter yonseiensis]
MITPLLLAVAALLVLLVMTDVPRLAGGLPVVGRFFAARALDDHNAGASVYDTDVRFWGKVLDSQGVPLEGVHVRAAVTTLRVKPVKGGAGFREFDVIEARTDATGRFALEGASGFVLKILKMTKDGYVLPHDQQLSTAFGTNYREYLYKSMDGQQPEFKPDPANPVEFRLWKLQRPEPLMIFNPEMRIPVGGPPQNLSMDDHGSTTDPDFKYTPDVKISVSEIGTADSRRWEVRISGWNEDCGVVKADPSDPFLFEAPENGYEESITCQYGPEDMDGRTGMEGLRIRFFVRSKKHLWHGAVDSVFPPPEDGRVRPKMEIWTNPAGSRNLEHNAARPLFAPPLKPPSFHGLEGVRTGSGTN